LGAIEQKMKEAQVHAAELRITIQKAIDANGQHVRKDSHGAN
jgi:hypothetical protein